MCMYVRNVVPCYAQGNQAYEYHTRSHKPKPIEIRFNITTQYRRHSFQPKQKIILDKRNFFEIMLSSRWCPQVEKKIEVISVRPFLSNLAASGNVLLSTAAIYCLGIEAWEAMHTRANSTQNFSCVFQCQNNFHMKILITVCWTFLTLEIKIHQDLTLFFI